MDAVYATTLIDQVASDGDVISLVVLTYGVSCVGIWLVTKRTWWLKWKLENLTSDQSSLQSGWQVALRAACISLVSFAYFVALPFSLHFYHQEGVRARVSLIECIIASLIGSWYAGGAALGRLLQWAGVFPLITGNQLLAMHVVLFVVILVQLYGNQYVQRDEKEGG